ncbi:MAG: DUF58 domain-containing protein [Bacteroidetes bacterium]|nr:DUF58 domain-containing protein [Bacteroidota bacterium]
MKKFFQSLYLSPRLFLALAINVELFINAYFLPPAFIFAIGALGLTVTAFLVDLAVLYRVQKGIVARRNTPEKLSNGDENEITLELENYYNFTIKTEIFDELPFQFQKRDTSFLAQVSSGALQELKYTIRPTKRGEYEFGAVKVYAKTPLGLVSRRFVFEQGKTLPVYPSYMQMRQYEIMAMSNRLQDIGVKRIRKLGHSMEFEQIRDYVVGDDLRTLNWKATARSGRYMVNQYTEEKSQPIYCMIDKGRMMKMPFKGLSLLDYAINATLVMSNIAIYKQDRAGLITFAEEMGVVLKAKRNATQMQAITEILYNQKTRYLESDFELLYTNIRRQINHRSLMLIFTNFDSLSAMHRQLPYLRRLNKDHLLVVIFFENTELQELILAPANTTEEVYLKTVAEKFAFEKRQIVRELNLHGIQSILTAPENLTVNTLNKYLELKARGVI